MNKIKIVTDSGCDLIDDLKDVICIPYFFRRKNEEYLYQDNGNVSKNKVKQFINLVEFETYKPSGLSYLETLNDDDTDYVILPSGTARYDGISCHNLFFEYTGLTSGALGLLIRDLQNMLDNGASIFTLIEYIENNKHKYNMIFVPNEEYSGQLKVVNSTKSSLASFFELKPILSFKDGDLVVSATYKDLNDLCKKLAKEIDKRFYAIENENYLKLLHSYQTLEEVCGLPNFKAIRKYVGDEADELGVTNMSKYGPKVLELAYKEI